MKEKYIVPFSRIIILKMEVLMNASSPDSTDPEFNPPFSDETDW